MKRLIPNRRLTTLAGLAIAFLAVESLAPAKAVAACGDYVSVSSEQRRPATQRPCSKPDQSCPFRSQGNSPCQGAECSRGEVPPLVPPTAPTSINQEFTCLGFAPSVVDRPSHFRPADFSPALPSHLTDPVFRPPRFI